jgi:hypothetical protein
MGLPSLRTVIAFAVAMCAAPLASAQNLITNGAFDGINGVAGSAWSGCVNCYNGSNYTTTTQQLNGNLSNGSAGAGITGWSMTTTAANHSNYTFALTANQANTVNGFSGNAGSLYLYPTASGPIQASPNGGNFIAMDGGYELETMYQTITGLTINAGYKVGFYWAASQQATFAGTVTDSWLVSLSTSVMAPTTTTANGTTIQTTNSLVTTQKTTGWNYTQMTFTATAATMVLSFLAQGSPAGQPPFSLLDGVTMQVPEPATAVLMVSGLAGLFGLRRSKRRKA